MSFLIYIAASVTLATDLAHAFPVKMLNFQLQPLRVWQEVLDRKNKNIFVFLTDNFYEQFNRDIANIAGETLNVTVSQKLPYANLFTHLYEGHDHEGCGYIGDLWHELEDVLHFKTNFTVIHDIKDEREALKNSTDNLLLNPIIVKSGDHDDFDMTMPIAITWYQLSAKNPGSTNSFFYMSIFTVPLMLTFLVMMVTLTFTLWFMLRISGSTKRNIRRLQNRKKIRVNPNETAVMDNSFMGSFLTILGVLTNQGVQAKPTIFSLRLLILVSTVLGFVLTQSYSAILITQLAVKKIPEILLQDLPQAMPHRSLCISKQSAVYKYFLESNNSTRIHARWKSTLNRPPCSDGQSDLVPLDDYCSEETIVFESSHNTNYIRNAAIMNGNNTAVCKFHTFPWRYYYSYISLITKKGFKYTNLISMYLLRFHTVGIIKKYQETWLPLHSVRVFKNESNEPIKFEDIKDVLYLYFIVAFISIIILSFELMFHNIFSPDEYVSKNVKLKRHKI